MSTLKSHIEKKLLEVIYRAGLDSEKIIRSLNRFRYIDRNPKVGKNKQIINDFSNLFYDQGRIGGTWDDTKWLGTKTLKNPLDLWVYQEIIFEILPDLIIETGTAFGGSALYLASIMDLIGKGKVITIDVYKQKVRPPHPRIQYLIGSSTSQKILRDVKKSIKGTDKVMVILDSDHSYSHVREELKIYSDLVTNNGYLIVEDTNVNSHPVYSSHGPGPWEAVAEFLRINRNFVSDKKREKYLLTNNPEGFLKKTR